MVHSPHVGAPVDREGMVKMQIEARGIRDPRVLDAMRRVPREVFCPSEQVGNAHADHALPIGEDQTISQPYIVALMAELMQLEPASRVLEVGTGCGYAAAVFGTIAADGDVFTIERHDTLLMGAARRLTALGYDRVHLRLGDGRRGWPEAAPFDAIAVAAAAEGAPPEALLHQLKPGGRLVIPVGTNENDQVLYRYMRANGSFKKESFGAVRFVPLVG
jgi:protein-L-isoaspartate(D-aspartate) O-methyltransferase